MQTRCHPNERLRTKSRRVSYIVTAPFLFQDTVCWCFYLYLRLFAQTTILLLTRAMNLIKQLKLVFHDIYYAHKNVCRFMLYCGTCWPLRAHMFPSPVSQSLERIRVASHMLVRELFVHREICRGIISRRSFLESISFVGLSFLVRQHKMRN